MTADYSEDSSDDSNENKDNSEHCHVCLLSRIENFALLHDDFDHRGFCKRCASRMFEMKSACPLCKEYHKGSIKDISINPKLIYLIFIIISYLIYHINLIII